MLHRAQDAAAADAAARPAGPRRKRGRASSAATPTCPTKCSASSSRTPKTIRKGKIAKPTEFGKLVTIQEAEHQIVTAFDVHAERPADVTLWTPALDRHQQIFGRAPDLATGDRGFSVGGQRTTRRLSAASAAWCCRGPGRKSPARRAHERQRWFRRGQRWRIGCEGRISVLKRRHGLRRCRYHGARRDASLGRISVSSPTTW